MIHALVERVRRIARDESVYILLFVFIILFNILTAVSSTPEDIAKAKRVTQAVHEKKGPFDGTGELMMTREQVEKILRERPHLSFLLNLTSLLMLSVILLGSLIDFGYGTYRMRGGSIDMVTYRAGPVRWSLGDVARVVILFLFMAYVIIIAESFLIGLLPVLKNDNFRMMLNSVFLDVLGALFVIYFAVKVRREKLSALGLTLKRFWKNVFYGIVGYIAGVPIFIAVIVAVFVTVKLTGYIPERQPVVELFLKEQNPSFLVFSSVFASVFGPFIEELFFRGFMYNAAKRRFGIWGSMILTSIIFASLHTNVVGFLPIMALGILLAYLYERTGSLVASITVHMTHNLAMVYLVFLVKRMGAV